MKKLLLFLLLGLLLRPGLAPAQTAPPTVPATLAVFGLRLSLDDDARQQVQRKVNSLSRHPASFQARAARARAAFPLIDQALAAEGVPVDFHYLALQESALQGNAASAHGAVGYWQMKRETAQSVGLTVSREVDERSHLVASTRGAARYLKQNNAELRNWFSALLSYYTGLGGVKNYVRPEDAGATELQLGRQSPAYVFDFLAHVVAFGPALAAPPADPAPVWREVPAPAGETLSQLAARLDLDPAVVADLNPWLLASAVPADGRPYTAVVPGPPPAEAPLQTHSTAPADQPPPPVAESPAAPPAAPGPAAPAGPAPSAPVVTAAPAPPVTPTPAPTPAPAAPPVAAAPAGLPPVAPGSRPAGEYRVGKGETLFSLARQAGVRPRDLALFNRLLPDAGLRVGQLLRLPAPGAALVAAHVVAAGDTFYSLARRYACPVPVLQAHNDRPGRLDLRPGETLRVPAR